MECVVLWCVVCPVVRPVVCTCVGLGVALRRKELQALREELEVLSLQHAHRCVENAEMVQELQRERRAGARKESQGPEDQEESQGLGDQEEGQGPGDQEEGQGPGDQEVPEGRSR